MNKTYLYLGSIFLLSGTIIFSSVYSTIGNYIPNLTGWSSPPGKFATVLENTMQTFPFIMSLIFLCIGLILLGNVIFHEMKSEKLENASKSTIISTEK